MKILFINSIYILGIMCLTFYSADNVFSQGMGIGIAVPVSQLHVYENTTNVNAVSGLTIEQGGTGDAVLQYLLSGGQRWVTGIDNSDGDKFKISSTVDLGSSTMLTIQTTGEVGIGTSTPSTNARLSVKDGHIQVSQTTAPAISVNSHAGSGAGATLGAGSNDVSGTITLTTGSASWSNGINLTIAFNKSYTTAPFVILTPANDISASSVRGWYPTSTTTTFSINDDTAVTGVFVYKFNYLIIEP